MTRPLGESEVTRSGVALLRHSGMGQTQGRGGLTRRRPKLITVTISTSQSADARSLDVRCAVSR